MNRSARYFRRAGLVLAFLGASLFIARVAEAVVIGASGRYLQVVKTDGSVNPGDNNALHIGEVEAFTLGATPLGGIDPDQDVALSSKGAVGSTVSGTVFHGADANLVNGAVDTGANTWTRVDSSPTPNIVAQVDLGQTRALGEIRVWQRGDGCCQNRLESFAVNFYEDGGGTPGALVDTWNYPGQAPTNSFASFALSGAEVNPGVVGGIGNDDTITEVVASAGAVSGAKRVRLVQNVSDTFQIAEIEALEVGSATNVALQGNGGVASASDSGFSTTPAAVNDGSLAQNYPNLWHSSSGAGAWVQVEFASATDLDQFHIYGRSDCCQGRQDDFDLVLFDSGGAEIHRQRVLGLGTSPGNNQLFDLEVPTGLEIGTLYPVPHTFEIDADTLTSDTITVPSTAPSTTSTLMDVNGADLTFDVIAGNPLDLVDQTLQVLIADSFTGSFSSITPPALLKGMTMDTSLLLVDGTVTFHVPEPASLGLLALGLLGLGLLGRRRRRA